MTIAASIFHCLGLAWFGYEFLISHRRRANDGGAHDQGTLRLLWRVLYVAIAVAVAASFVTALRFAPALHAPLLWIGSALIACGLALRWWAIHVLARWFTVDVTIHADHQLIRSGPYRWLRHPSYSGALLAFYGLGVGLGSPVSLLVLLLAPTWAFARRIRVEEQALLGAFGAQYRDYAAHSWRLLPGVW